MAQRVSRDACRAERELALLMLDLLGPGVDWILHMFYLPGFFSPFFWNTRGWVVSPYPIFLQPRFVDERVLILS